MSETPFQVDLTGLIKILSDHLYSSKEVFVRELLQNAVDALVARSKIEKFNPAISITYFESEAEDGFIIEDNGIGLTVEQTNQFLAKIGSSSKSTDKLKEIRSDFIGQFGIGILSCFMVSDNITVLTKSAKEGKAIKWTGNIQGTNKIEYLKGDISVGTKVILAIRKGAALNAEIIEQNVYKYGSHLKHPISLSINNQDAKWINTVFPWEDDEIENAILLRGNEKFNERFENYILLKTENNEVYGVLYILPRASYIANITQGELYVKRMFITQKLDAIMPEWAVFVRAFINSNHLDLNASRETIYTSENSDQLTADIEKAIMTYFQKLSKSAPSELQKIIKTHNAALKQLALNSTEFLKFIYKWFTFQTSEGYKTVEELQQQDVVYFVPDVDEFRQVIPVAKANGKLVVNAGFVYEADLINKIAEVDNKRQYAKIDTAYFGDFLGEVDFDIYTQLLDRLSELQEYMDAFNCQLVMKEFEPQSMPAIYYASNEVSASRDIKNIQEISTDLWAGISKNLAPHTDDFTTLYLNLKNRVVNSLLHSKSQLDKQLIEVIYLNAMLLGHYPLNPMELEA